jgi:hypothetical protein
VAAGCRLQLHTSLPDPGRPRPGLVPLLFFEVDEPDPCRCIDAPPIFDSRFLTMGRSAFAADDTATISHPVKKMGIRFSGTSGRAAVETGCCPAGVAAFFRKASLSLTFWIVLAFLNMEALAGVERGVGGVAVPSCRGVLCPVVSFGEGSAGDPVRALGSSVDLIPLVSCAISESDLRWTILANLEFLVRFRYFQTPFSQVCRLRGGLHLFPPPHVYP